MNLKKLDRAINTDKLNTFFILFYIVALSFWFIEGLILSSTFHALMTGVMIGFLIYDLQIAYKYYKEG